MVLVEGEPGIGKTALARETVEQARRLGYTVGVGIAHETDNVSPLASLGPALRSGVTPMVTSAEFLDLAPVIEQPLWLAERLADLLRMRADAAPLLVVLDDAQWADPLSTFVLRIVPARLADAPIVWFLTSRPAPGGPADLVAAAADVVNRIMLDGLSEEAVLELAADRLGHSVDEPTARQLADTKGVPFVAVQVAEGLAGAGLPAGLTEGVRQRMAAMSPVGRSLLRTGVVLGDRFQLDDAANLMGEQPERLSEPLDEVIRAGLVEDDGTYVAFRHDLLRQAVYAEVPPSARRALHSAIVEQFLNAGRRHAEVAPHVLATAKAGDLRAVEILRQAAYEIVETMSTTSAAFIQCAFDLLPAENPLRSEVGRDVVAILVAARCFDKAMAFAVELLSDPMSDDVAEAVRLTLAPRLWASGRYDELASWIAEAADGSRLAAFRAFSGAEPSIPAGDDVARSVLLTAAAENHERLGNYAKAYELYVAARGLAADEVGCLPPVLLELRELSALAHISNPDAVLPRLADLRQRPESSWYAARIAAVTALVALGAGRLELAASSVETAAARAEGLADHPVNPLIQRVRANVATLRGRRPFVSPAWQDESLVQAAVSASKSGDTDALRKAVDSLTDLAARNPDADGIAGAAAIGRGLITGDLAAAIKVLRTAHRPLLLATALEEQGRLLLSAGDRDAAVAALDEARDSFASLGATGPATRVQRIMQAAGVRRRRWNAVPQRSDTGWEALTTMERRVALLIADGHTNRSAAAELTLSPNTISTHLRAVFTKLNVTSRVQLTKLVLAQNPPT